MTSHKHDVRVHFGCRKGKRNLQPISLAQSSNMVCRGGQEIKCCAKNSDQLTQENLCCFHLLPMMHCDDCMVILHDSHHSYNSTNINPREISSRRAQHGSQTVDPWTHRPPQTYLSQIEPKAIAWMTSKPDPSQLGRTLPAKESQNEAIFNRHTKTKVKVWRIYE